MTLRVEGPRSLFPCNYVNSRAVDQPEPNGCRGSYMRTSLCPDRAFFLPGLSLCDKFFNLQC